MKIRVSLVDYLNSAPLGWSLLFGPHKDRFEVVAASPARCADQLARGEVDVGLIPSIEFQRIPDLAVIPGMAVAASDDVRSVLLVRRKHHSPIRTVALDTCSRTSVALLRLLLEERDGLHPAYVQHVPDIETMLDRSDAALLIGDAALRLSPDDYRLTDLAREWIEWQKLPFVFAFWACRSEVADRPDLVQVFREAKEWGLLRRAEIAAEYSRRLGLPAPMLYDYLQRNIDYRFDSAHVMGLETYYRLAYAKGLIPANKPLRFIPAGQSPIANHPVV